MEEHRGSGSWADLAPSPRVRHRVLADGTEVDVEHRDQDAARPGVGQCRTRPHGTECTIRGRTGAAGGPVGPGVRMSKDKGGRAAKKPKAEKNIKVSGQTPAAGSGVVSASTAKGKK